MQRARAGRPCGYHLLCCFLSSVQAPVTLINPPLLLLQARRALAEAGKQYQPMWFVQKGGSAHHAPVAGRKTAAHGPLTKNADEEGFVWSFTNEYWQRREARDWSSCPDLYS